MRFVIVLFIITITLITGCNSGSRSRFFNAGSLPTEQFSIALDRDTTLQTKNGALIQIPKGALSVNGGIAKLEIKEAYSIQQMIQGGLITNSNGQPLSSGGMIYINAAGGQKITFNQPIKVALPADHLEKDMQLFKGEKDGDGNINWTKPVPLPENKQLTAIERGKILFQQKCASCHGLGTIVTAPDLAHFPKRIPYGEGTWRYYEHGLPTYKDDYRKRFFEHLTDTNYTYVGDFTFYPSEREYKCKLMIMYPGIGPKIRSDSNELDRDAVFNYIQNESDKKNLAIPSHAYIKDCIDSCELYDAEITSLAYEKARAGMNRRTITEDDFPIVKADPIINIPEVIDTVPERPINFEEKVSPDYYDAEYYQFTIESFGWFNIDILLKDLNGVEESELIVRIVGGYRQKVEVYLIIPSMKVYGAGGPTRRTKDEYAFDNKNGKIPLPQNAKAWILAMTETNNNIAFALREFTTTRQQYLEISLQQSTMDIFNAAIQSLGFDELKIKVNETKNADEIRKTDLKLNEIEKEIKNAEGLKPRSCDCDCLTRDAVTVVASKARAERLPDQ